MTGADRISHLNSGLMLASLAAAYLIPFELFLLAYAVLGPLHYLTEISWIHDRRYFMNSDASPRGRRIMRLWLLLVGTTLAVMVYGLAAEKLLEGGASPRVEIGLFYLVLVAAALMVFRSNGFVTFGTLLLTAVGLLLFNSSSYYGLIAFFIITIVHVLIFTAAFVLLGALKTRSRAAALSLGVYGACLAALFLFAPASGAVSPFARESYQPFEILNAQLIQLLGLGPGTALRDIYESDAGAMVMRLIAFAYTYHYLNWFTKTSVIGWNKMPKSRAAVIALLWLAAVAIYAWDYLLGFVILYSLSVLHVMLELPLNHQSFVGIGRELAGLIRPGRAEAAPAERPKPSRKDSRKAMRQRRKKTLPQIRRGNA
jgi:hypothetical protein